MADIACHQGSARRDRDLEERFVIRIGKRTGQRNGAGQEAVRFDLFKEGIDHGSRKSELGPEKHFPVFRQNPGVMTEGKNPLRGQPHEGSGRAGGI